MSVSNDMKYGTGKVGDYNLGRNTHVVHRLTSYPTTHYSLQETILLKGGRKAVEWVNEQLAKGRKVIIEVKEKKWRFKEHRHRGFHWKKVAEIQNP